MPETKAKKKCFVVMGFGTKTVAGSDAGKSAQVKRGSGLAGNRAGADSSLCRFGI